jgi:L-ascorbate metabolism protein UlaG (beta-lactamase superfamily)
MVILGIKGHHAGEYGLEFGQVNTLWRLEIAGLNIVHWGDNGPLTAELKASLGKVDILMLPADDAYHLLAREQTNQVLDELKPLVVIPMHYYVPELEDEPIDDFGPLDEWLNGRESVMCLPGNSWQVSKETLPEKPEILVLRIADSVYEVNEVAPPSGTACAN